MKDRHMTEPTENASMTDQELAGRIEDRISKLISFGNIAENRTCELAEQGNADAKVANAHVTEANGYLRLAKAAFTRAGLAMPGGVTVSFGGK